jgi:hypothetical protein
VNIPAPEFSVYAPIGEISKDMLLALARTIEKEIQPAYRPTVF